jgi:hypothetical protein
MVVCSSDLASVGLLTVVDNAVEDGFKALCVWSHYRVGNLVGVAVFSTLRTPALWPRAPSPKAPRPQAPEPQAPRPQAPSPKPHSTQPWRLALNQPSPKQVFSPLLASRHRPLQGAGTAAAAVLRLGSPLAQYAACDDYADRRGSRGG